MPQFMQKSEEGLHCSNEKDLWKNCLAERVELQKFPQKKEERRLFWTATCAEGRKQYSPEAILSYSELYVHSRT